MKIRAAISFIRAYYGLHKLVYYDNRYMIRVFSYKVCDSVIDCILYYSRRNISDHAVIIPNGK